MNVCQFTKKELYDLDMLVKLQNDWVQIRDWSYEEPSACACRTGKRKPRLVRCKTLHYVRCKMLRRCKMLHYVVKCYTTL